MLTLCRVRLAASRITGHPTDCSEEWHAADGIDKYSKHSSIFSFNLLPMSLKKGISSSCKFVATDYALILTESENMKYLIILTIAVIQVDSLCHNLLNPYS